MAKRGKTAWCSVDVTLPEHAMAAFVKTGSGEGDAMFYPLLPIFSAEDDLIRGYRKAVLDIRRANTDVTVDPRVFVFPVALERKYALKPEFWGKPSVPYPGYARLSQFSWILLHWRMHRLLVTPLVERKKWKFLAALPYRKSIPETVIDRFMQTSDWPVTPEAKYCGIYEFGAPWMFDTETGSRLPVPDAKRIPLEEEPRLS